MNAVAQSFALIAALIHIAVFPLESFAFRRPAIHQGFFRIPTSDVPAVMLWVVNMGVKNLLLGAGIIAGLINLNMGNEAVGRTLVIFCCLTMFLSSVTMGISDLLGHYRNKGDGVPGTIASGAPPLIALVAAAF